MNILLIWPKARTDPEWGGDLGAIAEPLALEYLSAGVRPLGHTVKILDLRLRPDALLSTLNSFKPDIVGITAFSMHVLKSLEICKEVKRFNSNIYTVAGGHHATILPEDFFEDQMDYVVCGEGVSPFIEIVTCIEKNQFGAKILGVWQRKNNDFEFGGAQPSLQIDELPFPDREITAEDRSSYFIDWMSPVALLRTSVGCPYRCTFCSLWKIMDGKYIKREVDRVVEEAKMIKEDYVFLVDDEAFIDGKRMAILADALKEAGVYKRFFAYVRADTFVREKETIAKWKEIGLERVFMGIDAISEQDLSEFNKKYKYNVIEEALPIAETLGIEILAQFVVNTNYTDSDFKRLERFVKYYNIKYPTFTVLTPIPGTALLKNFDKVTEMQSNGRPNWDLFDTQNAVVKTKLPNNIFRKKYRGLFKTFKSSYQQFLIHKHPSTNKIAESNKITSKY